jgi:alpha-1,3-glucosyltransferase
LVNINRILISVMPAASVKLGVMNCSLMVLHCTRAASFCVMVGSCCGLAVRTGSGRVGLLLVVRHRVVQVHEKSILLPLLPVTLLAAWHPGLAWWLPIISTFSMYPLLRRDGLTLAYAGCILLFAAAAAHIPTGELRVDDAATSARSSQSEAAPEATVPSRWRKPRRRRGRSVGLSILGGVWLDLWAGLIAWGPVVTFGVSILIHAGAAVVAAPVRYPFLYDALFVTFSFVQFVVVFFSTQWLQWQL